MAKKKKKKKNILNLYPEDMERTHIWTDICDVLGIPYNCGGVEVEFKKVKIIK